MAIKRQKAYVNTLDQLLGDLPQLLLGMQANAERTKLAREQMKAEEDRALAQLLLANLDTQFTLAREDIKDYKSEIETIDNEFANSSTYVMKVDDVNTSSNNAALNALEMISNAYKGPLQDGINQRVSMAQDVISEAERLKGVVAQKTRHRDTLKFLKGSIAQGYDVLAAGGKDKYLVEASDMDPYFQTVISPQLKERGYSDDEIGEYRKLFGGMLGESMSRIEKAAKLKTYGTERDKENLNIVNMMSLNMENLSDVELDQVIKRTNTVLYSSLQPKLAAMSKSKVGSVIPLIAQLESLKQDSFQVQRNPEDPTKWDASSKKAKELVDAEFTDIGQRITGIKSSQPNIIKFNKDLGERLFKAMIAATSQQNPDISQMMKVLEEVEAYTSKQISITQDGRPRFKRSEDGSLVDRNISKGERRLLSNLLGFTEFELTQEAGSIRTILDIYKKKTEIEHARMIRTLGNPSFDFLKDTTGFNMNVSPGTTAEVINNADSDEWLI